MMFTVLKEYGDDNRTESGTKPADSVPREQFNSGSRPFAHGLEDSILQKPEEVFTVDCACESV